MNLYAKACHCGAVTIQTDDEKLPRSMKADNFDRFFPGVRLSTEELYSNCNHCINNWGLDICACGSGEDPKDCTENHSCCGDPIQTLEHIQEISQWAM